MLVKQRQYTKTKKAGVLSMKVIKEYNMRAKVNYKGIELPVRPPKLTGYVLKIGKVLGGKNRRYFAMDPIEGNLIKYMHKDDFPKKPKEIYCLANICSLTRTPFEQGYVVKVRQE